MRPFTTLKRHSIVSIWRKTQNEMSQVGKDDIGQAFTVTSIQYSGRKHNQYISYVNLRNVKTSRELRACIDELAQCNPNFEPSGEYLVCVSCGATLTEDDLKVIKLLNNKACPSCGVLEPTSS